ncbi:Armadillo repeat containing protein, partial [Oryctes borbonicus]
KYLIMASEIKELLKFMQIGARLDLKAYAVSTILGLTGTNEGIKVIIQIPELLVSLLTLLNDNSEVISKESALSLVNISANEDSVSPLLELDLEEKSKIAIQRKPHNIIKTALQFILDKDCHIADPCCMILSNLTRSSRHAEKVIEFMQKADVTFDVLINAFTRNKYNNKGASLHYLGPVLSNLSQNASVRKYILDKEKCVIQRLLPFTEYKDSHIRRGGIVGTLRNCCFDTEYHEWLLREDVDILPRLLLPLAGNNEYDEEDNDKLPLELQYLPEDKKREEDPDIRYKILRYTT